MAVGGGEVTVITWSLARHKRSLCLKPVKRVSHVAFKKKKKRNFCGSFSVFFCQIKVWIQKE